MNIEEYISSGILEQYALGAVSTQEKKEVECMSHIYPEIQEALQAIQIDIENFSTTFTKTPPPSLKKNILDAIENVTQDNLEESESSSNTIADDHVIPINKSKKSYTTIISIAALLAIIFVGGIYYINSTKQQSQKISALEDENKQLTLQVKSIENSVETIEDQKNDIESQMAFLYDVNTEKVVLKGTPNYIEESVTIYWNKQTKDVFLSANSLTPPPTKMQYQLWALVNGDPVDMGVFDLATLSEGLQIMSQVENAGAFAITLEKEGGSPTPNLDQLVVIGNV